MATIRCISSKAPVGKILNYIKDKDKTISELISGKDCSVESAKEEFKETKAYWNKTDNVQYHHVIQSFLPNEVSAQKAHQLGKELAESFAKDFECIISTHIDKNHVHNHIIINSVSYKDGQKYQSSKEHMKNIKLENDRICEREGLNVVKEPFLKERLTMAEYKLSEKGIPLWKDQLRMAIDESKIYTNNIDEMSDYLKKTYNIEMKIQNKNVSFLHPEKEKFIRGKKLGESYTKEVIEFEYREKSQRATHTQSANSNQQLRKGYKETSRDDRRYDELLGYNKSNSNSSRGTSLRTNKKIQGNFSEARRSFDVNSRFRKAKKEASREYKRSSEEVRRRVAKTIQDFRVMEKREFGSNSEGSSRYAFKGGKIFESGKTRIVQTKVRNSGRGTFKISKTTEVGKKLIHTIFNKLNGADNHNSSSPAIQALSTLVTSIIKDPVNPVKEIAKEVVKSIVSDVWNRSR